MSLERPRGSRIAPVGVSRQKILDTLESRGGELADPSGMATPLLRELVGYTGGANGFVALLKSMEEAGQITRDVRGRRCFRISLTNKKKAGASRSSSAPTPSLVTQPSPQKVVDPETVTDDVKGLAWALLQATVEVLNNQGSPSPQLLEEAQREIQALTNRVVDLEQQLEDARQLVAEAPERGEPRADVTMQAIRELVQHRRDGVR